MKITNSFFNYIHCSGLFLSVLLCFSFLCWSPVTRMATQLVDLLLWMDTICVTLEEKNTPLKSLLSHLFSSSSTHCQRTLFCCRSPGWNSPVQTQPSTHEPVSYTAFKVSRKKHSLHTFSSSHPKADISNIDVWK